jgi:DNA-binding transcriptional LysR family regulator
VKALEEIETAENAVITAQVAPQGLLKVTAAPDAGVAMLPEVLSEFLKRYPQVSVELVLTTRVVDLVAEGIDVALRAGQLKDSTLIARKVGLGSFRLFASPAYLKAKGTPRTPDDLKAHQCLHFTRFPSATWRLQSGREQRTVAVSGRLCGDDFGALRELAVHGHGIVLIPPFLCEKLVDKKQLAPVLPAWYRSAEPLYLVHPGGRFVTPKVRAFVQVAAERLTRVFEREGGN